MSGNAPRPGVEYATLHQATLKIASRYANTVLEIPKKGSGPACAVKNVTGFRKGAGEVLWVFDCTDVTGGHAFRAEVTATCTVLTRR